MKFEYSYFLSFVYEKKSSLTFLRNLPKIRSFMNKYHCLKVRSAAKNKYLAYQIEFHRILTGLKVYLRFHRGSSHKISQ